MIFTDRLQLLIVAFSILLNKPKISFERVKNGDYLELKKGLYIVLSNEKQTAAFNLSPLTKAFMSFASLIIVLFFLTVLLMLN